MAPLVEYWLEYHSREWLLKNARTGHKLPQKINFNKIADYVDIQQFGGLKFQLAIEHLFENEIVHETSNLDSETAANLFIQDLLDTPTNRKFTKNYLREGIVVTAQTKGRYMAGQPFLMFEEAEK